MAPVIGLGLMPFFAAMVLVWQRDNLDTPETREKIERMYQDVHLTRNEWTIFYYPGFLIRRYLFMVIPIMMPEYPVF